MSSARHQRLGQSQAESHFSRRSAVRLVCTVFAGLAYCLPALAATLVHHPYLQNLRENRVSVVWSTREDQNGTVQFSTDRSFSRSVTARVRIFPPSITGLTYTFFQYQADLTGLVSGTEYSYQVKMDSENLTPETDHRFRTAGSGPFNFIVFGDSGAATPGQIAVTLRMVAETPNFALQLGDIAYEDGTFEQFQSNYFDYYYSLMRRACFFLVPGNHEYYTNNAAPYLALHSPPVETVPLIDQKRYYSFDWGDAHFVGLDSNLLANEAASGRMLAWLETDLALSRKAWRIVYFHHLPYPISHHVDDPLSAAARLRIIPILERHGVQLVLTGHEHSYQRSKPMRGAKVVSAGQGTVYITSGGGGGISHEVVARDFLAKEAKQDHYLRVEVDASGITIRAMGTDGKEFDSVTLTQPSLPPGDAVVNGASFTPALAPGALVSIFGERLAAGTSQAASFPLPTVLSGSSVTLNGELMPLTYVSPRQINAQLPTGVLGPATLRVTTTSGYSETRVNISGTAPAIFATGILHANGAPVTSAAPARAGESLVVYMTGLGQVDGELESGQPCPDSPLLRVLAPVSVEMGDVSVTPDFAGLTPGLAGVYQVNLVVPSTLPTRVYGLRVSAKGNFSNTLNIQVQGRNP